MYSEVNYKTKKAMKEAIASGMKVKIFQPNAQLFGKDPFDVDDGNHCVEGPHYPEPHRWYASVTVAGGYITGVK